MSTDRATEKGALDRKLNIAAKNERRLVQIHETTPPRVKGDIENVSNAVVMCFLSWDSYEIRVEEKKHTMQTE
ncbi:hypothetical protein TNCV_4694041 [Trichonephila clavipes]|uniref:Uncharacterized protein n=1 Tax=Trichonephila clavipes TaxID=2585209 RepID=A0A8X7BHK6_TRICX|nr:hypothetical protein TNCV_4694041 [Trichonephila clavipes]